MSQRRPLGVGEDGSLASAARCKCTLSSSGRRCHWCRARKLAVRSSIWTSSRPVRYMPQWLELWGYVDRCGLGSRRWEAGQKRHDQDGGAQVPAVCDNLVPCPFFLGGCREVVWQVVRALLHQDARCH